MQAPGQRVDLFPSFAFCVKFNDDTVASFTECAGLEMTVKVEEVREGGQNEFVHKLPGRVEYGNLVLRRGYALGGGLFTWCLSARNRQKIDRKNVTVALIDQVNKTEVFSWSFLGAYPVKWSGPAFKAADNAFAVESLELAHRGLAD